MTPVGMHPRLLRRIRRQRRFEGGAARQLSRAGRCRRLGGLIMFIHLDDEGFTYSSDTEWDRAEAYELGAADPTRAWICTDRDVWHPNPFYRGPPVPHPEDYEFND